jgi:2',3'-cyclic-nucleotide 2'-phosphodiesterase (5'-nucleotidase family)
MVASRLGFVGAGTLLALALACSSKSDVKNGRSGSGSDLVAPPKPSFTLFALAEVRGQIGPCGCTSDPLGDIARTAKLVADTRAQSPTLFVDAGSLLYSKSPVPAHLEAQEELKADLLAKTYETELAAAAVGLGHADLAKGPAKTRLPRHAVNLPADSGVAAKPPEVITVGDAKVGVFGVIARDALHDVKLEDPVAAGKAAVADLRKRGAQVVVGLVQATA